MTPNDEKGEENIIGFMFVVAVAEMPTPVSSKNLERWTLGWYLRENGYLGMGGSAFKLRRELKHQANYDKKVSKVCNPPTEPLI